MGGSGGAGVPWRHDRRAAGIRAGRAAAAGRLLRAGPPRPADLGHRPLQLPLHLLHARGGHAVAAPRARSSPSRSSSGWPACSSSATASARSGSPAASPRSGPTCPSWSGSSPRCPSTSRSPPTASPCRHGRRTTWPRPACGGSTSRSTRCGPSASGAHPAGRAGRRARRASTPRSTPASRPVKVNVVVMRGVNDDEVVDLAALRPGPGRHGALHRVHAPRRRRRLARRAGRAPGRDPRADRAVFPLEPVAGVTSRPSGSATSTAAARSA